MLALDAPADRSRDEGAPVTYAASMGTGDITLPDVQSFGELLRIYRARSGLSQEALAERARISTTAIGALERGQRRAPYHATIAQLAQALSLAPHERESLERAANAARGRAQRIRAKATTSPAHNLPVALTSFIDRDARSEIVSLVKANRLVTVTGSAGVGKTRTVIEAARDLLECDGRNIWFLDLSSLLNGELIAGELALMLGVMLAQTEDAIAGLVTSISLRSFILIIDNCEHLLGHVSEIVQTFLQTCPNVSIVATSRERLRLSTEVVYRLSPLSGTDAVSLFKARAQSADSTTNFTPKDLELIETICRELDGIPLAIEIAASRMPALGLGVLRTRLRALHHQAAIRDLPKRQQTMMAAIAWSYDLLTNDEATFMRRIAIFSGGFTLEAAEVVCCDEQLWPTAVAAMLTELFQKSLLNVVRFEEAVRYTQLESIRAFAHERLDQSGEFEDVARRQACWLADIADVLHTNPAGRNLERELADLDNVRGAVRWALASKATGDAVLAGRIVNGFRVPWIFSNRRSEFVHLIGVVLERLEAGDEQVLVAWLYRALTFATDGIAIIETGTHAIELLDQIGDYAGVSALQSHISIEYYRRGDYARAEALLEQASAFFVDVEKQQGRQFAILRTNAAYVYSSQGRVPASRRALADLARIRARLPSDSDDHEHDALVTAEVELCDGNTALAASIYERLLAKVGGLGFEQNAFEALSKLCQCRVLLGDLPAAESAGRQALQYSRTQRLFGPTPLEVMAAVAAIRGHAVLAAKIAGYVSEWYRRLGYVRPLSDRASCDLLTAALNSQLLPDKIASLATEGAAFTHNEAVNAILSSDLSDVRLR